MPKVGSAADATEIAVGFLKSYHRNLQRPLNAKLDQVNLDQEKWVVEKVTEE